MASKEQKTSYKNLEPAADLDQKTLNKMAWRSCFLQASFNYERIHPFLVTFAMGIILSMEQKKVDIPTIRAVRVSLMGPLGGIGDALFWMTLVPITAGICSNMAIQGNAFGPILFLLIFNLVQFALRFGLMNWAYKMGSSAIDSLMGVMKPFTRAASIMGVFIVGCLTVTMGGTQINAVIPNGTTQAYVAHTATVSNDQVDSFNIISSNDEGVTLSGMTDADGNYLTTTDADGNPVTAGATDLGNGMSEVTYMEYTETPVTIDIANILDSICPKLVPMAIVMLLYYLFSKKNFTPMKGIALVLVLGILGAGPFGLWPSIWG